MYLIHNISFSLKVVCFLLGLYHFHGSLSGLDLIGSSGQGNLKGAGEALQVATPRRGVEEHLDRCLKT